MVKSVTFFLNIKKQIVDIPLPLIFKKHFCFFLMKMFDRGTKKELGGITDI